jgi:hypothetical protein
MGGSSDAGAREKPEPDHCRFRQDPHRYPPVSDHIDLLNIAPGKIVSFNRWKARFAP